MGNRSYQLTSASQSAHGWQVGQQGLAGNSYFPHGKIFITYFSEPLDINIEILKVFYFSNHFLFKSIFAGCAEQIIQSGFRL